MAQSDNIISVACDGCNKFVEVEHLEWFDGSAYCAECAVKQTALIPDEFRKVPVYHPVYFLYDKDSTLLHVTTDLEDAARWRQYQNENWWWFAVENINVKFFDSFEQAEVACKRLTEKLAPRYLDFPDPEGDLEGEQGANVYSIDPSTPHKTLDQIMTLRISKEMDQRITRAAVKEGVRKPQWVRSVLYDAARRSQSE